MTDTYPQTTLLGEIGGDHSLESLAEYTAGGDKLHMAYTFDLLGADHSPDYVRDVLVRFNEIDSTSWPCSAPSNHDVMRATTRWAVEAESHAYPHVLLAILLCLRGSVCLYQGEKLGLPEAEVPFDAIQDPYDKVYWPEFKGRDGCRTPMPWTDGSHAGFTTADPWLPVDARHQALAVDRQDADDASMLNAARGLLAFRRAHPALVQRERTLVDVGDTLLGFVRRCQGESLLCVFKLTPDEQPAALQASGQLLDAPSFEAFLNGGTLVLPAHHAAWIEIDSETAAAVETRVAAVVEP